MSTEDRLRNLLRSAGPPPVPTEGDWSIFVHGAHRDRRRRRVTAMVAAAVLVGGAAGVWAVDRLADRAIPPAGGGPAEPAMLPRDVPTECPEADPYIPASDLGTVAYVRDGDLYRIDLEGGEIKLVESGNRSFDPHVRWSPDGRWISFGEGYVVPARGGEVCAPLGTVAEPKWGADHTLVGWRDGQVLLGGPGLETREVYLKGHAAEPRFAVDDGRLVAIATPAPGFSGPLGEPAIWILDLATGNASRSHTLPPDSTPQIAGWSPDGRWILYWDTPKGTSPNGPRPLWAVQRRISLGAVQVGRAALYGDRLTWCGDMVVVTARDDRLEERGRRLVGARAPGWTPQPVTNLAGDIWSEPVCSPDGEEVVATTVPVYSRASAAKSISVHSVGRGNSASWTFSGDFETRNPTRWSSDGEWLMVELEHGRGGVSLSLLAYRATTEGSARRIDIVELGAEAEMLGPRAYHWYRP